MLLKNEDSCIVTSSKIAETHSHKGVVFCVLDVENVVSSPNIHHLFLLQEVTGMRI